MMEFNTQLEWGLLIMQKIDITELEDIIVNLTIDLEDACGVIDVCVNIIDDVMVDRAHVASVLRILSKSMHRNAEIAGDLQKPIMQMKNVIKEQPNDFFG